MCSRCSRLLGLKMAAHDKALNHSGRSPCTSSTSALRYDPCACTTQLEPGRIDMNRLFAALGAGWGAKKLGGGCFTTVLIFLLLYWLLRSI
jgi:hypothetical protein